MFIFTLYIFIEVFNDNTYIFKKYSNIKHRTNSNFCIDKHLKRILYSAIRYTLV